MNTITLADLKAANACSSQVRLFRLTFGESAEVTEANLVKAVNAGLDIAWLRQLVPGTRRQAYNDAIARAREAYRNAKKPAYLTYNDAIACAYAAYSDAKTPAYLTYYDAIVRAREAYRNAITPADQAFDGAIAIAKQAYVVAKAPAREAFDDAIAIAKQAFDDAITLASVVAFS